MMKNAILSVVLALIPLFSSCFLSNEHPKDIDPFFFVRNYGQFPLLPLSKPVSLYYSKIDNNWGINMLDYNFDHLITIQNQKQIGVCKSYVYGYLQGGKIKNSTYQKGDYVYANRYGGMSLSKKPYKSIDDIRIYPIDSVNKIFNIPQRWFIINVADSSTTAFFSKKKYEDYLRAKGISGKMYDIDKYHKQYKETGILPWFPDSIKVKLRK